MLVVQSLTFGYQVLYLSAFYKRSELALRIGIFYTATSLSGAFGGTIIYLASRRSNLEEICLLVFKNLTGLLARGLNEIGPRGGLAGWRWIFIIEGLLVGLASKL